MHLKDSIKTRFNRAWDDRLCIGVTGLSQSGKSTFITSFINQLSNHASKNAKLGKFVAATNHKIHQVKTHPLEDRDLPLFNYDKAITGLSGDAPKWPDSTADISGVLIEIVLKNGTTLFGKDDYKSVYVEIRDYPGEWLIDLPMRSMSFAEWSRFVGKQLQREPRKSIVGNPYSALSAINPLQEFHPAVIEKVRSIYCDFLRSCKNRSPSLSLLQPGRFLQPGKYRDSDMMGFIPVVSCSEINDEALKNAPDNCFYKVLETRFEQYKAVLIDTFFNEFISPVERQVILVDVLNVLNGGQAYVEDMIEALDMIGTSFKYKKSWFSSSIDQVHYIATKVDHVFIEDHENITQLLGDIVKRSLEGITDHKVKYKTDAVASVRSSIPDKDIQKNIAAIRARGEDGGVIKYAPPHIPDHIPTGVEWDAFSGWNWPRLSPPKGTRVCRDQSIQHIRMDYAIESLIGDLCD